DNDRVYALRGAEVFDPVTETWSRAGRMSTDRKSAAAASLADGSVLVVGGLSFNNGVLKTADRYLPERNR
ncbi:MAG: kelch repeat-containing protein, partial [Verrucomicrobiota bacterium]|nr:kelch repeat-containing protein [Verrucomicrobiota bacterium]